VFEIKALQLLFEEFDEKKCGKIDSDDFNKKFKNYFE